MLSPIHDADAEKVTLKSIPAISSLHNFDFLENGLQVWRAYKIGQGIVYFFHSDLISAILWIFIPPQKMVVLLLYGAVGVGVPICRHVGFRTITFILVYQSFFKIF